MMDSVISLDLRIRWKTPSFFDSNYLFPCLIQKVRPKRTFSKLFQTKIAISVNELGRDVRRSVIKLTLGKVEKKVQTNRIYSFKLFRGIYDYPEMTWEWIWEGFKSCNLWIFSPSSTYNFSKLVKVKQKWFNTIFFLTLTNFLF